MKNLLQMKLKIRKFSELMSYTKSLSALFLNLCLLFSNLLIFFPNSNPVYAQKFVIVTADQPNVWTLEQAHYLLAQMHRRNLDLKAKGLNPLDANEINGINIDILKSIMELGVTYNEADRFNNNLVKQDKNFNAERRRQLIKNIDELEKEKLELTKAIALLKREKETAESDDEADKIEAQIVEKTEIKAEVESQIQSKRQELSGLSSTNGSIANTTGGANFDPTKFPPGLIDAEIKSKLKQALEGYGANPQLNASLQLDKFLQLQYEIVSKQLTLLRDEVGPGERLIFLELPQSINANYDKSDDMWAQSRWRINGFTRCVLTIDKAEIPCHKILNSSREQNRKPRTTLEIYESITEGTSNLPVYDNLVLTISDIQDRKEMARRFVDRENSKKEERRGDPTLTELLKLTGIESMLESENKAVSEYKALLDSVEPKRSELENLKKQYIEAKCQLAANSIQCNNKKKEIDNAEDYLAATEAKISQPSKNLLDLILKNLNVAINRQSLLNKESTLNLIYRTELLNKIKATDPPSIKILNRLWIEDLFDGELYKLQESDFEQKPINLNTAPSKKINNLTIDKRTVRTIEIIPRQSSLNVNDIKVRNKSSALNFIVSTLFGIGGNFNYQQQREKYSQFVQQELYSSGFGKGAREFGWTFTSMPGTDRLLSGTRNTYAVLVLPKEATSIILESIGCSFNRDFLQPENFKDALETWTKSVNKNNCGENKNFVIPIPGGGYDANNDFYVSGLTYEPVEKGKKIVVSIYGNNFSSQIGVMINGVPLPASIGMAQNFIIDDSLVGREVLGNTNSQKVKGSFERVDSNQIVAAFEVPDGVDGTPIITLISPGKAVDLNSLTNLFINQQRNTSLKNAQWMFGNKPSTRFKVTDVQVFVSGMNEGSVTELTALITGDSLGNMTNVFVNGREPLGCTDGTFKADCPTYGTRYFWGLGNVYQIKFPPPTDEKIQIVLVSGSDVLKLNPVTNPAKKEKPKDPPTLANKDELNFTIKPPIPIYTDDKKTKIAQLLVQIDGKGFNSALEISLGQLDVVSETKAFITINDPKPAQTIKLTDTKKNIYTVGVVEISEIIKPTPTPTPKPSL